MSSSVALLTFVPGLTMISDIYMAACYFVGLCPPLGNLC